MAILEEMGGKVLRLRVLNAHLDAEVRRRFDEAEDKPQCRGRGCNACCNMLPQATVMEAFLIVSYLVHMQRAGAMNAATLDNVVLKMQEHLRAVTQPGMTLETWFAEQRGCMFLGDDGGCMVYEARPATCRTAHSVEDPRKCEYDSKDPLGTYARLDLRELHHRHLDAVVEIAGERGSHRMLASTHPLPFAMYVALNAAPFEHMQQLRDMLTDLGVDPAHPETPWLSLELSGDGKSYEPWGPGKTRCCLCKAVNDDRDWHELRCPKCGAEHALIDVLSGVNAPGNFYMIFEGGEGYEVVEYEVVPESAVTATLRAARRTTVETLDAARAVASSGTGRRRYDRSLVDGVPALETWL